MPEINTKSTYNVTATLAGLPGAVDPNTPLKVVFEPAANVLVENVTLSADGTSGSFDITPNTIGDLTYTVTADKNLAVGMLDIVATGTVQVVEAAVLGADTLVVTEIIV
jgi:hypothetical protein